MAKHRVFGNRKEPRCETCSHGKLAPDGQSVLCERHGPAPLDHHCRRYAYDPLRRTPRRAAKPDTPDAAAFSLDDTPAFDPPVSDSYHRRIMNELRTYLDETTDPDVDTILSILHVSPDNATEELLREAAALAVHGVAAEPSDHFIADDSEDIFDDLARLGKLPSGAAHAALHEAGLHLDTTDEDGVSEPPLDSDSLLFTAADQEDEEAPLSADDLVLLVDNTMQVEPAYDTPLPVPEDALSIVEGDDADDDYDTVLPIPDDALTLLDNDEDIYDD